MAELDFLAWSFAPMASYSVFKKSWLARTSNRNIQGYNPQQSSSTRVNCVRWGALTFGTNGLKSARWSCCDCFAATIRQVGFLIVPSVVALILQILLSVLTLGQKQRFEMIHANVMFLRKGSNYLHWEVQIASMGNSWGQNKTESFSD